jgi:poly(ADP-ribose) glycohydrolase
MEVLFANKVIGGGILGSGAVQEEIMMAVAPEMIVARLFTAPLEDNEVLFITGAKRFSKTSGYSDTLVFDGHYEDTEVMREVVAMDANIYSNPKTQYPIKDIEREVNKAYCAFYSTATNPCKIATGHWGCGASGGDRELKAVIQIIAASKVILLNMT